MRALAKNDWLTFSRVAASFGNRYRFVQRYRSGQPETLDEEFDSPFTRLDWIGHDRFDIQWHRHTGAGFCLYRGLSLTKALNTVETDGLLHPL